MEVRAAAIVTKDRNLIKYINDPTTDMHRDCFSFDTKILTENGFKFYNEIKDGDKIAQYNPTTDKVEYVTPLDRICREYTGEMYYIRKPYIDVCVTPNHRLYLKKYREDEYKIILAKNVKKASYYVKTGADITDIVEIPKFYFSASYGKGRNIDKKYHDEFYIKQDDMFELLGYLITDGHFKYHKQVAYRINLSQIKEYSKKIMKSCIDRIKSYTNFNFHEEAHRWSMSNKVFCNWLCENFGADNKTSRKLPKFITHAPIKQLKIFFDACMLGDEYLGKSGNYGTFFTTSTQLIEDFQFICMRLGYSSRVKKYPLIGNRITQLYRIIMLFTPERNIKARDLSFGIEEYEGKIFCFTVPSGILVTQRNNKISIQGNCSQNIWLIPQEEVTKDIRFYAKNSYVFATLYGSYWQDTGTTLWETCIQSLDLKTKSGIPLKQHMKDNGISTLNQFLEHCKSIDNIFWNERFKDYAQWKKDIVNEYQKNGFITNLLGFKFSGIMNKKQLSNFPVQSISFHLLLWILLELDKIGKKQKWKSWLNGQIHDEGILDAVPEEVPEIVSSVKNLCLDLPKQFPWINVPISMEFAVTPIGKSWYDKEELK